MVKVKITQEQADAIEDLLKYRTAESIVREKANPLLGGGVYICKSNHTVFTEIELDTIIRALYIGYEVEPEFKEGQWIVLTLPFTNAKITARILDIDVRGDNRVRLDRDDHCWWDKEDIRLATPSEIAEEKERRFFARHGRKPWELKKGDILHRYSTAAALIVETVIGDSIIFQDGDDKYLTDEFKQTYRVVCFVEDRKDVDNE